METQFDDPFNVFELTLLRGVALTRMGCRPCDTATTEELFLLSVESSAGGSSLFAPLEHPSDLSFLALSFTYYI
jgi:hypothetical protein